MWQLTIIHELKSGQQNMVSFVSPTKKYLRPLMHHPNTLAWTIRDKTGDCDSKGWGAYGNLPTPYKARIIWNEVYGQSEAITLFGPRSDS